MLRPCYGAGFRRRTIARKVGSEWGKSALFSPPGGSKWGRKWGLLPTARMPYKATGIARRNPPCLPPVAASWGALGASGCSRGPARRHGPSQFNGRVLADYAKISPPEKGGFPRSSWKIPGDPPPAKDAGVLGQYHKTSGPIAPAGASDGQVRFLCRQRCFPCYPSRPRCFLCYPSRPQP